MLLLKEKRYTYTQATESVKVHTNQAGLFISALMHSPFVFPGQSFKENRKGKTTTSSYPCPYCDKVFCQNIVLVRHIRRHTGEKPFKCPVCPSAFPRKSSLQYHMMSRHPGVPLQEIRSLPHTYT